MARTIVISAPFFANDLGAGAAKLFAGDTLIETASAVTEYTNAKGTFACVFGDVAAGKYSLHLYDGDGDVAEIEAVSLDGSTGDTIIANGGSVVAATKADAELGTADGGLVANAAAAATQSAIASAQSTTAATQSTIAANAAVSAPASTVSLLKIDEDFGKDPGGLLENAIAARKLAEADDILENVAGSQVLNKYERGTSNKLVPTKSAKKIGGGDLTNPTSQRWAGYREEA